MGKRSLTVLGLGLITVLITLTACDNPAPRARTIMIAGVKHVMNGAEPSDGILTLELAKVREIDPIEKGAPMRSVSFARSDEGSVVLYDANRAEAHLFDAGLRYRGRFFQKGQGPGEFTRSIHVYWLGDRIIVFGYMERKLAFFDKDGRLIREEKPANLQAAPIDFVREGILFVRQSLPENIARISLEDFHKGDEPNNAATTMLQEKLGRFLEGPGGVSVWDDYGFPDIVSAFDRPESKFYVGLDSSYKIFVKDLKGKTLSVIESARQNKRLTRAEKAAMGGSKDPSMSWVAERYPDFFMSYNAFRVLPRGWLAVERIAGPWMTETDVFDSTGTYRYILKMPEGVAFKSWQLDERGVAGVVEQGDDQVYREYRVADLSRIFR